LKREIDLYTAGDMVLVIGLSDDKERTFTTGGLYFNAPGY